MNNTIGNVAELLGAFQFEGVLENTDQLHDGHINNTYTFSFRDENGKLFSAWTLDSEETIKKAIDMGVDTYFTNDTPLALRLEREYGLEEGRRGGQ